MEIHNRIWATGGFRVNSNSGEGGLISFPLLLLEGNAILPMTPKAGCVGDFPCFNGSGMYSDLRSLAQSSCLYITVVHTVINRIQNKILR